VKQHNWKLGHIVRLNLSEDGQVRSADVAVGARTKGLHISKCRVITVITQPLFHLCPLEIPEEFQALPSDIPPAHSNVQFTPTHTVETEEEEEIIEIDMGIGF